MRTIIGILIGTLSAVATVAIAEAISHQLIAFPPFDESTKHQYVDSISSSAKSSIVAGWGVASFVGAAVAALIAKRSFQAIVWVIALVLSASIIYNHVLLPHPAWMLALGVGLVVLGAWLGSRIVRHT